MVRYSSMSVTTPPLLNFTIFGEVEFRKFFFFKTYLRIKDTYGTKLLIIVSICTNICLKMSLYWRVQAKRYNLNDNCSAWFIIYEQWNPHIKNYPSLMVTKCFHENIYNYLWHIFIVLYKHAFWAILTSFIFN